MSSDRDAEQERVRRLLGEAGGPEPVPDDVSARLEATLTGLVRERAAVPTRRTPRRSGRVLLAAAAVLAVAVGVPAALRAGQDGQDTSSTAGGTADESAGRAASAMPSPVPDRMLAARLLQTPAPIALRGNRLAEDLRSLVQRVDALPGRRPRAVPTGCLPRALGPDEWWAPVRYDGRLAVLVLSDPEAERVTGTVSTCTGDRLASAAVRRG